MARRRRYERELNAGIDPFEFLKPGEIVVRGIEDIPALDRERGEVSIRR